MKKVAFYFGLMWRPVLSVTILIVATCYLLTFRLQSLVSGASGQEVDYYNSLRKASDLFTNPLFLPVKAIHGLVIRLLSYDLYWMRITSIALALLITLVIFLIMRSWHTVRIALLTSGLFLTSSWVLLVSRSATSDVSLMFPIALGVLAVWLQNTNKRKLGLIVAAVAIALLIYIPGAVWIIIPGVIWKRKHILATAKTVPFWYILICCLVFLLLLVPAFLAVTNISFIRDLLGIPTHIPNAKELLISMYRTVGSVFIRSSLLPSLNMGRLPLLDMFSFTMFVAGLIVMIRNFGLARNQFVVLAIAIMFVIASLGGAATIIWVLPFIYIVIGNGVAWTLKQWFAVFPRNPVARNVGVVLIVLATCISMAFNSYRYFVAWPHMEHTKNSYNRTL